MRRSQDGGSFRNNAISPLVAPTNQKREINRSGMLLKIDDDEEMQHEPR
jgi:hypothetical protein